MHSSTAQNAVAMITAAKNKDKIASRFIWDELSWKEKFHVAEFLASMMSDSLRMVGEVADKSVDDLLAVLGRAAVGEKPHEAN